MAKNFRRQITRQAGRLLVFLAGGLILVACGNGGGIFGIGSGGGSACGDPPNANAKATGLARVNHIIVMMQENRSFDNYFGALAYAPGSPYHSGPCTSDDNQCVDGLTCTTDQSGALTCTNSNPDGTGTATSFHDPRLCVKPDLDHSWTGDHYEAAFADPNNSLGGANDGFANRNDSTEQNDNGENPTDDDTMGFYTHTDLPYYYALAQTFALDDRYFSSALAPTIPNRMYELAGTSFGHITSSSGESTPPISPGEYGYKPDHGTIFDLLDNNAVCWKEYVEGGVSQVQTEYGSLFRDPIDFATLDDFTSDAANGTLPMVSFVDLQDAENEHPPDDIRAGEQTVAGVIEAVRSGPNWKDSIILFVYDEGGGFYDHVTPPAALSPDRVLPGKCTDRSGNGNQCDDSAKEAQALCAKAAKGEACANFNQYGFRVPFVAISPFSKPAFVSHTVGDHGSILALIEKRFTPGKHLTARDGNADDLEDLFDFDNAPSMNANVSPSLAPPARSSDPGC